MSSIYTCKICFQEYLREDLKDTCESKPIAELPNIKLGSVFKCEDGLIGIFYGFSEIERQTHERGCLIARADPDVPNLIMPEVVVNEEYLSKAKPVSEQEFDRTRRSLENQLKLFKDSNAEHIKTLRELSLIPYSEQGPD